MAAPRIWILFCLLMVLSGHTDGRATENIFDSTIVIRTAETFSNIQDALSNYTSNKNEEIFHINNIPSATANGAKLGVGNSTAYIFHNITDIDEKMKNCSTVVGGALAGAAIGVISVGILVPLILCLLGFTCWGIMAGSAAACCQSGIGDVPAGSCFSCLQSLGAGGGTTYLTIACIVGVPLGLYVGGLYADTQFHCFSSE